ncbi:Inosamine-phosphate amidinotransferase 1 [Gammaproteobacteria bacterium]
MRIKSLKINVHNEWDPLEEIIVGIAHNAQFPPYDRSFHATFYGECAVDEVPTGKFADWIVEEAEEDLALLADTFQKLGISVRRPQVTDHSLPVVTPLWKTEGLFNYCPRDILLAIGDTIIESPSPMRARLLEAQAYHHLMPKVMENGCRWIAAPRPVLADELFDLDNPDHECLKNTEVVFDAANVLRLGRDILFLISNTGNDAGLSWLQNTLGETYRVHSCRHIYKHTHIDTTLIPLRPGLIMVNGARVNSDNLPPILKSWDTIYFSDVVDIGFSGGGHRGCASEWIGLNLLMINPTLAVVDKNQMALIRLLEKYGIDCIPLAMRHARTLGGGFHCVTLDTRRKGTLESYF